MAVKQASFWTISSALDRLVEVLVGGVDQIGDVARLHVAGDWFLGSPVARRTDQHETRLVRNRMDHAAVGIGQRVGRLAVVGPADNDLAVPGQPRKGAPVGVNDVIEHAAGVRAGGIDQNPGENDRPLPVGLRLQRQAPMLALTLGDDAGKPWIDARAALAGIHGIGDDQPGIVGDAVAKREAVAEQRTQHLVGIPPVQIEPPGAAAAIAGQADRGPSGQGRCAQRGHCPS